MPVLSCLLALSAEAGVEYVYDVNAVDPEGLTPTYQLLIPATLPSGMTFNTETGVLIWIPSSEDVGELVPFVFQASDGTLTARQSFTVRVQPANTAPELEAIADRSITAEATLRLDVDAVDGEGDPLTFILDQASRDRGLTIDAVGRLTWNPTASHISTTPYEITVSVNEIGEFREISILLALRRPIPLRCCFLYSHDIK